MRKQSGRSYITSKKVKFPNFVFENRLWKKRHRVVAGVDEVGKGCFAGPVVAGCVAFPKGLEIGKVRIDDSKKLTPKQREEADKWIKENACAWGVGEASAGQINRLGIKKASEIAFRKAIAKVSPEFLLIDFFFIPFVRGLRRRNQLAIVNGDEISYSIAAASIIAKVYRDRLMLNLSKKPMYKKYGWDRNKGYGTKQHQKALKKYGSSRLHRKGYIKNFVSSQA